MKSKKIIFVLLLIVAGYFGINKGVVNYNNYSLKKSITAIKDDEVYLNQVVPFSWEKVYTFSPYMSKEEIEQIIGFKSNQIKENSINEGLVQLLFVKDKKVVASVLSYAENLGYSIGFKEEVSFEENAVFTVTRENGVVRLSYKH